LPRGRFAVQFNPASILPAPGRAFRKGCPTHRNSEHRSASVTFENMPTVFEAGNDELKLLREEPTLQRLDAYFRARTREWPHSLKHMECFTVGVFFDLGSEFQDGDAFDLLGTAAQLPWDDLPDQSFLLGIDLLLELASASGTTEMPQRLTEEWDSVASRILALEPTYLAWTSLVQHYRRT